MTLHFRSTRSQGRQGAARASRAILLLLLLALAVFLPATAQAAPAMETPAPPADAPSAGEVVEFTNGDAVTLPKDWEDMTAADLAAIGILPNTDYSTATPQPRMSLDSSPQLSTSGAASSQPYATIEGRDRGFTTMDASGCNKRVCIILQSENGSGPKITYWGTTANNLENKYVCTYAAFWVAGKVDGTTPSACDDFDEWQAYNKTMPRTFADGTQLCNTWVGFAGKPCKEVQK